MPQRFLRPGITTSDAWNSVSFGAQSFYVRILTLVDDYGRYDGRPAILHAHCFALRPDVSQQDSAGFGIELENAGLIQFYDIRQDSAADGSQKPKRFLQITKWTERARNQSKYPAPPEKLDIRQDSAADGSQNLPPSPLPIAIASIPSPLGGERASAQGPPADKKPDTRWFPENCVTSEFKARFAEWEGHCEQSGKALTPAARRAQLSECSRAGPERSVAVIAASIEKNSRGVLYWDFDQRQGGNGSNGQGKERRTSKFATW